MAETFNGEAGRDEVRNDDRGCACFRFVFRFGSINEILRKLAIRPSNLLDLALKTSRSRPFNEAPSREGARKTRAEFEPSSWFVSGSSNGHASGPGKAFERSRSVRYDAVTVSDASGSISGAALRIHLSWQPSSVYTGSSSQLCCTEFSPALLRESATQKRREISPSLFARFAPPGKEQLLLDVF